MSNAQSLHLLQLLLVWIGYFLIHSALASLTLKRWVALRRPAWMRGYRLFFNLSALLLVIPPLWLTYSQRGPWLWAWDGPWWYVANGLALAAIMGVLWSSKYYDGAEFIGLRQWRQDVRTVEDQEALHISPMHRWVRHPWYSLGLVLIWTRDMDATFLLTAVAATLYFVIGSRLEERKLMTYHGDAYARYRTLVPSLLPLPWRRLSDGQVDALLAEARGLR